MAKQVSENNKVKWNNKELSILDSLNTPEDIQAYLDKTPYNPDDSAISPRRVMRENKAHCFEGALFAYVALEHIGYKPQLIYIIAVRDDGHLLTVYRKNGKYGCLAKSNFTGLRYRSPIYKTIRELVVSYFEDYFNTAGELTLRKYTHPVSIPKRKFKNWQFREDDLNDISDYLDLPKTYTVVTEKEAKKLRLVDNRLYNAGLLGTNKKGLYKV